ncbi:MAG: hypothetical protein IJL97_01080, partial [Lachnospiraceae bacterium]|nr:hypothetical protein [Lachnospiraceae bacterium]
MAGKKRSGKSAYLKDMFRSIMHERKRFFAIVIITALGVMMFSGLKASCKDLRVTADDLFDAQSLHDIRVQSTLGLTDDDVKALSSLKDTDVVEGIYAETVHSQVGEIYADLNMETLSENGIDVPLLLSGRMPEKADETVVTEKFKLDFGLEEGDTFTLSEEAENFVQKEFTIVGTVIDITNLDNPFESLSYRAASTKPDKAFVLKEAVDSEYYTSVVMNLTGASDLYCFSDAYTGKIKEFENYLNDNIKEQREKARYQGLVDEAEDKIAEEEAKAQSDLSDARLELIDGEGKLKYELAEAYSILTEAENDYAEGVKELDDAEKTLRDNIATANNEFNKAQQQID